MCLCVIQVLKVKRNVEEQEELVNGLLCAQVVGFENNKVKVKGRSGRLDNFKIKKDASMRSELLELILDDVQVIVHNGHVVEIVQTPVTGNLYVLLYWLKICMYYSDFSSTVM